MFSIVLLLVTGVISAQDKVPPPTDEQAADATKLVREIYEPEYRAAATPSDKANLARSILDAALAENDLTARFVMLRLARNIAINAGDVGQTQDCLDAIDKYFDVDVLQMRMESAVRLCSKVDPESSDDLMSFVEDSVRSGLHADRYEMLNPLAKAFGVFAAKSRSSSAKEKASEIQQQIKRSAAIYKKAAPFVEALKANPVDPEANLAVGSYYCFVKHRWAEGLKMLSRGSDPDLAELAQTEIKATDSKEDQLRLGDLWWEQALKQTDNNIQVAMKLRAGQHYLKCSGKLKGLSAAKARKRAEEAAQLGQLARTDAATANNESRPSGDRNTSREELLPVQLREPVVEYKLPAAFDDVVVGGSGRYLVFHLSTLKKLAFFDVMAGEITQYVPLESNDVRYTCGAESFYIAYREHNTLQRWGLKSFKKELTVPVPFENPIDMVILGAGSTGPLFIGAKKAPGLFLDAKRLRPINFQVLDHRYNRSDAKLYGAGPETRMRASFNGQTFTNWSTNVSPAGFRVMVVAGRQVHCFSQHDTMGYLMPSPDGELIHTGKGIFTRQTRPFTGNDKLHAQSFSIPAVHGIYSLRVVRDDNRKVNVDTKSSVTVHVNGNSDPLLTLPGIRVRPGNYGDFFSRETVALDKRIFFIPACNLIVTLPNSNQLVVMHQVDLEKEFEKAGIDYLFVDSRPIIQIAAGKQYRYQINVRSKNGGLKYKLDSGPPGMKVSSSGVVTWRTSRKDAGSESSVIVSVSDAKNQSVTHSFKIRVQ